MYRNPVFQHTSDDLLSSYTKLSVGIWEASVVKLKQKYRHNKDLLETYS